jgi:hypothetical protein
MMGVWFLVPMLGLTLLLLGLYRATVGSVRLYPDRQSVLEASHDLDAGGTFRKRLTADEVKGRGYLWLLAQRAGTNRVYTLVTLMPEKRSPKRKGAVAIKLGRQTLGHLGKVSARQFHLALRTNGWPQRGITCPAAVTRRQTTGYGIWLDFPTSS